jgi:hypothetical protein
VFGLRPLPLLPDDVSLASLGHDLLDDVVHTEAGDQWPIPHQLITDEALLYPQ